MQKHQNHAKRDTIAWVQKAEEGIKTDYTLVLAPLGTEPNIPLELKSCAIKPIDKIVDVGCAVAVRVNADSARN